MTITPGGMPTCKPHNRWNCDLCPPCMFMDCPGCDRCGGIPTPTLPPLVLKNCMTACQCPPVCCNKPMHGNPAPKDWVCRECGAVMGAS